MNLKKIYSKEVYSHDAYYIDSTSDVLLDVQPGRMKIVGLITPTLEHEKKMIAFNGIKAIGDIIILE